MSRASITTARCQATRPATTSSAQRTYASKALDLISAWYDDACVFEYAHPTLARMMAIKSTCLPGFTRRDLAFFKIIDARPPSKAAMHDPELLRDKQPVEPKRLALSTALGC